MSKIKKIVLIVSALLSLGYFGFLPALADSNGYTAVGACDNFSNQAQKSSCQACQTQDNGPVNSLCVCHPEYNYGTALTDKQLASCEACNQAGQTNDSLSRNCLKNNRITTDINTFVDVLSALATIVIIGTLIAGGIQYSMAGNPQAAQNARKRIINGLMALAALFFIWAFLQWLIPGGV